jgi:hypothetical protein
MTYRQDFRKIVLARCANEDHAQQQHGKGATT